MTHALRWLDAVVRASQELSPTVREFEIAPLSEDGLPMPATPWTPGSHLDVQVMVDGRPQTRSYSLVAPAMPDAWRIAVKRVDTSRGGSRYLWSLPAAGARLRVREPDNHFELRHGTAPVLLVAGGIGITPIVAMAQTLAAQGRRETRLLYAARNAQELVYADRLREWLLDRMVALAEDRDGRLDVDAELARLAPDAEAYVCGPLPMLDALRRGWAATGRPSAALRFETFGSSGLHAPQDFRVRVPRHGVDIRVPAEACLLDALEAAGVETMSECRRGECGLCAMPVLSVAGTIDHRDVFLSDREKDESHVICACVSRVAGGEIVLDSAWRPD